jgi:hypothetical protein
VPAFFAVTVVFPVAAAAQDRYEERLRFFASRLDAPVAVEEGRITVAKLLEKLEKLTESADGKKRVKFEVDSDVINRTATRHFDPQRTTIHFSTSFKNVPMSTILEVMCQQIHAGYMVRKECIEIVSIPDMRAELDYASGPDRDFCNLVVRFYDNVALEKAFNDLADRHGRTVALSPKAATALKKEITARLVNVPFETAIECLADQAGLKVVHKSNVLMIKTREDAEKTVDAFAPKPQLELPLKPRPKIRSE